MPESEVVEALHAIADGLFTVAGSVCYLAANQIDGKTPGEKRELAAVMFHTARMNFGGVKHDGRKIGQAEIAELDALWSKMTGKALKR